MDRTFSTNGIVGINIQRGLLSMTKKCDLCHPRRHLLGRRWRNSWISWTTMTSTQIEEWETIRHPCLFKIQCMDFHIKLLPIFFCHCGDKSYFLLLLAPISRRDSCKVLRLEQVWKLIRLSITSCWIQFPCIWSSQSFPLWSLKHLPISTELTVVNRPFLEADISASSWS